MIGLRVGAVERASIINEPTRRADGAPVGDGSAPPPQWDHTSMLATAKNLFGLPDFLTKRDAWAGSFEELLLEMRYSLPTNKETNRYVITDEIVEERISNGKLDAAAKKRDSA